MIGSARVIALDQPLILEATTIQSNSTRRRLSSLSYQWTCQYSSGINFGLDCTSLIPLAYQSSNPAIIPANTLNISTSYTFSVIASISRYLEYSITH